MSKNPFDPCFDDLPEEIPIFPLEGVVLLPKADLPLNIFEPRYLGMVGHALKNSRIIGIVQPIGMQAANSDPVFRTGCAGRITQFSETEDGCYRVTLRGLCRFHIQKELPIDTQGYRRVKPSWLSFESDMSSQSCIDLDRSNLCSLLRRYLEQQEISLDWPLLHEIEDDAMLMTTLAMICPFSPSEKQALLEAPCCSTRANLFMSLLDMAVNDPCSRSSH